MSGNFVGMALGIIILMWLAEESETEQIARPSRMLDLGNLMLTFVMLWAYTSFSQFLIIWSGNLPDENPWYHPPVGGGWQWIGLILVLFHFAVPFLLLLSRYVKRRTRLLGGIAVGMIVMRFVDIYWNVQPAHWSFCARALARCRHCDWSRRRVARGVHLATRTWAMGAGDAVVYRGRLIMPKGPATHDLPVPAHETRDLSIRAIVWFAAGLVIGGVVIYFVLGGFWVFLSDHNDQGGPVSPFATTHQLPPEPRLQVSPPAELRDFRLWENQQVYTYGWVNRPGGVVRLPIDRAMDVVLERGLQQGGGK